MTSDSIFAANSAAETSLTYMLKNNCLEVMPSIAKEHEDFVDLN